MKPIFSVQNGGFLSPIIMTILERQSKKELIVGFSGTKNPAQLIDEFLNNKPVDYEIHNIPGAKVFEFFYSHYVKEFRNHLQDQLKSIKDNPDYKNYKIIFTGHSLGAALTNHAVADALLSGLLSNHKVSVYTYGQPRIGNKDFLDGFIGKIGEYYRIVNFKDAVTAIPPCVPDLSHGCISHGPLVPIFPYHSPTEIFYSEGMGSYQVCSSTEGEDPNCSDKNFNNSVDDHLTYFGVEIGKLHENSTKRVKNQIIMTKFLKG